MNDPARSSSQQVVSLIAAMSDNRVIGDRGKLPWRLPADLKYFKQTTRDHTIIMGRKTWESIGCKPLPHRRNIVVTRRGDYTVTGGERAASVDEALAMSAGDGEVFVVGGGEIYRLALPRAQRIYMTQVHSVFEGDATFPIFDEKNWSVISRTDHPADGTNPYPFSFVIYENRGFPHPLDLPGQRSQTSIL